MIDKKKLPSKVRIELSNSEEELRDPFAMLSYDAELLFRHVFGDDKYYHTASNFDDPSYFKKHIKKLFIRLRKDIDNLQASEIFINRAKHDINDLENTLLQGRLTKERQQIIVVSLQPVITFLGYGAGSKYKTSEPYFIPSVWQERLNWTESEGFRKKLDVDYRTQIAIQLKEQGLTHAEISEVLNQTGYRIAQLLNNSAKIIEKKQ